MPILRKSTSPLQRHNVWGVIFVAPALTIFAVFAFYPMLETFFVSLTRYDLLTPREYIGIGNYIRIFDDPNFLSSLRISAVYVVVSTVITLAISLGLALLLNSAGSGGATVVGSGAGGWLRTVYFFPTTISLVVVAILGRMVFQPRGLMFAVTSVFNSQPIPWLNEAALALSALISVRIWRTAGYFMVFYLAGLQNIPRTYYEVADMDGASHWQRFRSITWPLLKPTTLLVLVTCMINAIRDFAVPHVMTGGGPAGGTRILSILIYENAFQFLRMGRAAAMSVVMFAVLMTVTLIQIRFFRSEH